MDILPDYDRRVDSIFDDLLASLPSEERRALEYAALLPEDLVLDSWLIVLLESDAGITLPDRPGYEAHPAEAVVAELRALQLLSPRGEDDAALSLHRVLRRHLNEGFAASVDRRDALLTAIETLAESRGQASHGAITDQSLRPELTPLLRLSEELRRNGRLQAAASLANWLHTPLRALGRFLEDRTSLSRFTEEQTLTAIGPAQAGITFSNLALILSDLGELAEARRGMERSIAIDEKHFDPDHPTLATSYSNLATILSDLGELAEARRSMERAIAIAEKHFDPDHPTLATHYSNLAMILRDLGELAEARRGIERSIAIDEKHFDPDHPMLATSYNNLGHITLAEGKRDEACELFRRAHAIWSKHFSADHPHVQLIERTMARECQGDER